jgi:hypothetical protein
MVFLSMFCRSIFSVSAVSVKIHRSAVISASSIATHTLYVTGGKAQPVFNSENALIGFDITSDVEGAVPVAGGVVLATTGSVNAANAVSGAFTTGAGMFLDKVTGNADYSWGEIAVNTLVDGAVGLGCGKAPGVKGITSGRNSWSAVFRSGLKKLWKGSAVNMSKKVFRKGILSSIVGGYAMDIYYGIKQHAYPRTRDLLVSED